MARTTAPSLWLPGFDPDEPALPDLPPEADAQLHIIVADLGAGAEAAQGKHGEGKRAAGVVQVAQASNAYGKYFSHSGWKAVKLPH